LVAAQLLGSASVCFAQTLSAITPNNGDVGGTFNVALTGSGFINYPQNPQIFDTMEAISVTNPTWVSSSLVTATFSVSSSASPGTDTVEMYLDDGRYAGSVSFTILPPPQITSLSPNSAIAGGSGFTLTVNGAGFASGSVVRWNGTSLSTTGVSATQLTAQVPANLIATPGTAAVTVAVDSLTSNSLNFTIVGPNITLLTPNTAIAGGPAFTLTVNGLDFVSGAVVQWNGSPLNTTFTGISQLTAQVPASLIATAGTAAVTVVQNAVTSNSVNFTIAPGAVITSLSPSTATAGGAAFTLTVNGTGFVSSAVVQWNGTALSTTFVSATQLTAQVTASLIATAGTAAVTVLQNAATSNSVNFTIAAGPVITSLSPSTATAGAAAFTLTVNGTGFVSGAVVQWNGTALNTTFVSATQLTAQVTASLIATAGTAAVTVLENAVTSNSVNFTIVVGPVITSLSPSTATAGAAAFTLTVNGTGFVSGAVVQWNSTALSTTFVSATQLTAQVTATLIAAAGTAAVTVLENAVTSNSVNFTIAAGPMITSLSPSTATAGAVAFTLTVNGTGFVSSAVVQWNGAALNTTFVSATQLTAQVAANLIGTAGTAAVTVVQNAVTSNSLNFTIAAGPAITSLSPNTATAGGAAFTLTVNGTGFVSGAVVQWNGAALSTTFVSVTQLTAQVAASLIATAATAAVTVLENEVTSNSINFTIAAVPLPGVSLTGLAATTLPTQTTSVGVLLNSPATTQLDGTLTITFQADPGDSNTPPGYQDPNLMFVSSGATTVDFSIPAEGTTTATLGIQQGTVAGTITVTMTSLVAGTTNVLPQPAPSGSVTVSRLAPVISSGSVKIVNLTSTGFQVQLDAFSTPRDVTGATFNFSGTGLTGTTSFQVSLTSIASDWFSSTAGLKNGGNFQLTVPFTFSGDTSVLTGVSVTLSNSVGSSSPVAGGD
jgi:hypothetical protein